VVFLRLLLKFPKEELFHTAVKLGFLPWFGGDGEKGMMISAKEGPKG
jgi:hypothetical protein